MLALISPAKKLDFQNRSPLSDHTQPMFQAECQMLVKTLKTMPKSQLKGLMSLSDNCLLYTSPSPRDVHLSRMPSSA